MNQSDSKPMFGSPLFGLWKSILFKCADLYLDLDTTPPMQLRFETDSLEVHSLVCKSHLKLYLLAIKSFLRYDRHVKVVVHDDGSLSDDDMSLIQGHIEGAWVISAKDADQQVEVFLKDRPHSLRYRERFPNAKQTFDYALLSESDRLIGLDSDVLFLRSPDQLLTWIHKGECILHLYESEPRGPNQIEKFLGGVRFVPNVNVGLLCYYKSVLDLDLVEECLGRLAHFDWWTGQMIFAILLSKSTYPVRPLDPGSYTCEELGDPNMLFKHYVISHGIRREYIRDLKRLVKQLATGQARS